MIKKIIDLFRDFNLTRLLLAMRYNGYLVEVGWFNSYKAKIPLDENNNPIPWVTYSFLEFIKKYLKPEMNLFEFGSGNSSIFYSSKVKNVYAVEHHKGWFETIKEKVPDNCNILYQELEYGGKYSETVNQFNILFDVIIIDGRDRVNCIKNSVSQINENGLIVLDDAQRDEYKEGKEFLANQGFKCIEFWGTAPHCFHNKATNVYFKTCCYI